MTSESGDSIERRWLVEPPGRQELHFQVKAGDRAEITPEIREAFERLLEAFGDDVEGYKGSGCSGYVKNCPDNNFACAPRAKCSWEVQQPCFIDYQCKIASLG
jgi:hypothetical protein